MKQNTLANSPRRSYPVLRYSELSPRFVNWLQDNIRTNHHDELIREVREAYSLQSRLQRAKLNALKARKKHSKLITKLLVIARGAFLPSLALIGYVIYRLVGLLRGFTN